MMVTHALSLQNRAQTDHLMNKALAEHINEGCVSQE